MKEDKIWEITVSAKIARGDLSSNEAKALTEQCTRLIAEIFEDALYPVKTSGSFKLKFSNK